jgi:hypothetical protein
MACCRNNRKYGERTGDVHSSPGKTESRGYKRRREIERERETEYKA